jgi:streptogramin lyase
MRIGALAAVAVLLAGATLAGAKTPPSLVVTGRGPCGIAARSGDLWVGVYGAGRVLNIDPRSGRINASVNGLRSACRVAVGPAAVWVTRDQAGQLVRISRGTGRVRRVPVGTAPLDVLLARGSVWVTSAGIGIIAELDPATANGIRIYRDGDFPAGLTWCGGRVWVGHAADLIWLTAIRPATHRIARVRVGTKSPRWPRCVRDELWVTTMDSVLRIDPRSEAVTARIHIGGTPVEASAGPDGLVWVTDKERSLVFRVDPRTNAVVDSFSTGPGAYAMARVGPAMWVTSFAGSDVRRYER